MGRILVEVLVENFGDVERVARGELPADRVRRLKVSALVDSGATFFCLPKSQVEQLGMSFLAKKESRTVTGVVELDVYAAARVEVQGRDCVTQVLALPDGRQPLLGQIPLEMMDWWIDTAGQRLVGNPEHGGQWMAEIY